MHKKIFGLWQSYRRLGSSFHQTTVIHIKLFYSLLVKSNSELWGGDQALDHHYCTLSVVLAYLVTRSLFHSLANEKVLDAVIAWLMTIGLRSGDESLLIRARWPSSQQIYEDCERHFCICSGPFFATRFACLICQVPFAEINDVWILSHDVRCIHWHAVNWMRNKNNERAEIMIFLICDGIERIHLFLLPVFRNDKWMRMADFCCVAEASIRPLSWRRCRFDLCLLAGIFVTNILSFGFIVVGLILF